MVGGTIIEIIRTHIEVQNKRTPVMRLWCVENHYAAHAFAEPKELAVYAEPWEPDCGPMVGESIWWQGGWIMFDRDRRRVRKIGFSFDPRNLAQPTK